jgi:hypothetical protein
VTLGLVLAVVVTSGSDAAGRTAATSAADAGRVPTALTTADSGRSINAASRAAPSLTPRQRAAVRRLQVAARNLHRTVDAVVRVPNDADFVFDIQLLSDHADFILTIRNARAVGLDAVARRYQRVLDLEMKRLDEARAFSDLLRRAHAHGEQVAQKSHEDHPSLSPAVLGNIAVNAANWYGNDALLKVTLRTATRKSPDVYEITLKKGEDLDRRAYALYRALSVGSRKTNRPYRGREGLHQLPDANGGFNGGLIGLRRGAESSSKSPAIDINIHRTAIKIHVRHEP